ncbi:acyltransferase [Neorhizobium sp. SOG26]|uniref:GNAT family N-acetyltransferase n=1 Tax=Neorhizobium sp. SOG26 TaxID=2060726 RepID=UPI000E596A79|nr:1-acyl-sn-glycerol-3-phosphate acyltransferase [Neorhizobium sp. SOG26]AXV16624.1 acyltransferase [Neorhizobium sp. SOG26]
MERRALTNSFGHFAETLALLSHGKPGHIVDTLIAERGERIVQHPAWPAMRPLLYSLLRYNRAIKFANDIQGLSGFQSFEYMSDLLKLNLTVAHAERIPEKGGFILVSNHPTGIADGVAIFDLLKPRRPDLMIFANRDAVRVNPRFAEMIIPVEWREEYKSKLKTRETLVLTNKTVEDGKVMVLFPSGRIAYWENGKLNERPWKTSAVGLARKYNLPILPIHMRARNSGLFYWLAKWSTELRDMTVFYELLNKKGNHFDFTVGQMIQPEELEGEIGDVTKALEHHTVIDLADDGDARFAMPAPDASVAA